MQTRARYRPLPRTTLLLGPFALILTIGAFSLLGPTGTRVFTGGRYFAAATPIEGKWVARGVNSPGSEIGTVHATLAEVVTETGPIIPRKDNTSRNPSFVDQRVSHLELSFNGLNFIDEMRSLASKTSGGEQSAHLADTLQATPIPGLTHTPEQQAAAREALLLFFAEERPDLVERLRQGEVDRVIYRSPITSRQVFWVALAIAALCGAIAWKRSGRQGPLDT